MAPPGWSTADQLCTHQLTPSIINNHNIPDAAVFDAPNLSLLQQFCADPAQQRETILREHDWVDAPGDVPGTRAARQGSLVGLLVARYGTAEPGLDGRDLELLTGWFGRGMPVGEKVVR